MSKKRKRPNVYVKLYPRKDDTDDPEMVAKVFLSLQPWHKVFYVLSHLSPDSNFFNNSRNFAKYDIIAAGEVLYDGKQKGKHIYYGCSTRVANAFQGMGYGDILYKAMILAAKKHANKKGRRNWRFTNHTTVGGATSNSAQRVYESLNRKGYLVKAEKDRRGNRYYKSGKTPKFFKPIYF